MFSLWNKEIVVSKIVFCKKDLYKSTYLSNAFIDGKAYSLIKEDDYVWIRDEKGREFNFVRDPGPNNTMYVFADYFT